MILNQEGNDCIWKLQCHCIQILHSDIYSVGKLSLKMFCHGISFRTELLLVNLIIKKNCKMVYVLPSTSWGKMWDTSTDTGA